MSDWKKDFANEVDKAIFHEMTQHAIDELLFNLRSDRNSMAYYGLLKLCNTVGHVARAQALGIDVDSLRMDATESAEWQMKLMTSAAEGGAPVIVVTAPEGDQS